jgi:hypothetical protein
LKQAQQEWPPGAARDALPLGLARLAQPMGAARPPWEWFPLGMQ